MARAHAVAPVVIDATDQRRFGLGAGGRVIVPLDVELGLHRLEKITIENGRLLAGKDLTPEDDLADIKPVAQKIGERATEGGGEGWGGGGVGRGWGGRGGGGGGGVAGPCWGVGGGGGGIA